MERVTEAATVEVGWYYLVPRARVVRAFSWRAPQDLGWVPVIGPQHNDREILGFSAEHWHYDWRFISDKLSRAMGVTSPFSAVEKATDVSAVELRRRRCLRPMPVYSTAIVAYAISVGFPVDRLEAAYAAVRIKPDCRVCPHRGIPLNGLPVVDGVVACPGHGLAWNIATGKLVRRAEHRRAEALT